LRRAALGILRTIIENKLNINIVELTEFAAAQIKTVSGQTAEQSVTADRVIDFIFDRLKGYCLDHGYTADEFDAVITVRPAEPLDFMQRLQAVKAFRQLQAALQSADDIKPLLAQRDYQGTLNRLATLRNDVDAFFDYVMVMTDDLDLRANRLALLNLLSEQFLTCADISKLQS
jgi:glycyl-tRNA synthetase beta chain